MSSELITRYWAMQRPDGRMILNILEVTEGWVWAVFYSRQKWKHKSVLPSYVPPDFIRATQEAGYKVVRIECVTDETPPSP